ncbi:MAG: hypothetical protein ABIY70_18545 [Capsulimonas sp.]|uniref:hypothetical protein n=1 Tax=Capsulimonas sp. TaxID=2494211 RepID=UPI0032649346
MTLKQAIPFFALLLLPVGAGGVVRAFAISSAHSVNPTGEFHTLTLPSPHHKLKRNIKPSWDTTKHVTLPPRKTVAEQIADLKAGR